MRNYKKILGLLLTLTLSFGVVGCGSTFGKNNSKAKEAKVQQSEEQSQKSGELKKVTIAATGTDGTLTEVARIAQSKGFFEEELEKVGYTPDYQGFAQAGPAINEAFAGGTIDVAFYGDLPAVTAKSNGVDIKIIASATSQLDYAILGAENTDIKDVTDLKGKKIAVGFGTVTYKYLDDLLKKNGLTISDVEIVNTSVDGPTMLSSGQVDAFVTQYGAGVAYQAAKVGKVIFSTKDTPDIAGELILAARNDFLKSDRDAAVAIVKALYGAYNFAKINPDQVYDLVATENFPAEIQKQVYTDQTFAAFNPEVNDNTKKKLSDIGKYAEDNQLIKSAVNIDDLIDTSISEEVIK